MSALEDLYFGNCHAFDKYIKKGSEYERLANTMMHLEEQLLQRLSAKDKEVYEQFFELRFSQELIAEKEMFIDGFRLGAQIALEIVTKPNKQLLDN